MPMTKINSYHLLINNFKQILFFLFQIGYLGILGSTHNLSLGPNKIGRDPQTCNIILDSEVSMIHITPNQN